MSTHCFAWIYARESEWLPQSFYYPLVYLEESREGGARKKGSKSKTKIRFSQNVKIARATAQNEQIFSHKIDLKKESLE